ncbi:MAG: hypothetical protein ACOX3S_10785 [Anaerolineae bacterium]|jgi:hypothetical protein
MSRIDRLVACLDMAGCPNRCRHCWLGVAPNGRLTRDDLCYLAVRYGDPRGERLFARGDYVPYLLNRRCQQMAAGRGAAKEAI